jgi:hypothetical protein
MIGRRSSPQFVGCKLDLILATGGNFAALPQTNEEARTEQRERSPLWHLCGEFGSHHLAIAGLEIGDQDLVGARVERAAAGVTTACSSKAARPAAVTAPPPAPRSLFHRPGRAGKISAPPWEQVRIDLPHCCPSI